MITMWKPWVIRMTWSISGKHHSVLYIEEDMILWGVINNFWLKVYCLMQLVCEIPPLVKYRLNIHFKQCKTVRIQRFCLTWPPISHRQPFIWKTREFCSLAFNIPFFPRKPATSIVSSYFDSWITLFGNFSSKLTIIKITSRKNERKKWTGESTIALCFKFPKDHKFN